MAPRGSWWRPENGSSHLRTAFMSATPEPAWKRWLDRLLMVNVLLVFIGAGVFAVAVVRQGQGHDWLMDQVQLLWQPLFAPSHQPVDHGRAGKWHLQLVAAASAEARSG